MGCLLTSRESWLHTPSSNYLRALLSPPRQLVVSFEGYDESFAMSEANDAVASKIVIHQKQQDAMATKIVTHPNQHLNGRVVTA